MPQDWRKKFSAVGAEKSPVLPLGSSTEPKLAIPSGTTKPPWYDVREWSVVQILAAGAGAITLAIGFNSSSSKTNWRSRRTYRY